MDVPAHQFTMTVLMTPDTANFAVNVAYRAPVGSCGSDVKCGELIAIEGPSLRGTERATQFLCYRKTSEEREPIVVFKQWSASEHAKTGCARPRSFLLAHRASPCRFRTSRMARSVHSALVPSSATRASRS